MIDERETVRIDPTSVSLRTSLDVDKGAVRRAYGVTYTYPTDHASEASPG